MKKKNKKKNSLNEFMNQTDPIQIADLVNQSQRLTAQCKEGQ